MPLRDNFRLADNPTETALSLPRTPFLDKNQLA